MPKTHIIPLSKVGKEDISLVGLKGANLGEMLKANIPIPQGFVVCTQAFFEFIKNNKIDFKILHLLNTVNEYDPNSFNQVRQLIRQYVLDGEISKQLSLDIYNNYKHLSQIKDTNVAVRSSLVNESISFKNYVLNDSFLNIKGETNILLKIKECWAMFIVSSIINSNNFDKSAYLKDGIAVIIQRMIESEKSGVTYTLDPQTCDRSKLIIKAIYGLGDFLISSEINPDIYEIDKKENRILSKTINTQYKMLKKSGNIDKITNVFSFSRNKQKISDKEIISLATLAIKIEKHYYFPQIIEWSMQKGKLYILEIKAISETINSIELNFRPEQSTQAKLLLQGIGIQPGIKTGHIRIINKDSDMFKLQTGEIIVINDYHNHDSSLIRKAGAYIQNLDLKKHHIMIFKKDIGIPTVVNTKTATQILKDQSVVTVNANTGEIYAG
jgi:pyruvate, water dikinase